VHLCHRFVLAVFVLLLVLRRLLERACVYGSGTAVVRGALLHIYLSIEQEYLKEQLLGMTSVKG
jgi:hypothetical protein